MKSVLCFIGSARPRIAQFGKYGSNSLAYTRLVQRAQWPSSTHEVLHLSHCSRDFGTASALLAKEDGSVLEQMTVGTLNAVLGKFILNKKKFDGTLSGLKITEVTKGTVVCSIKVEEGLQNGYSTLHGGAAATLIDLVGTAALLTINPTKPGVSVEINVSYVSAAKADEELRIEGRVLKTGKSLGFSEVEIRTLKDNKLVAIGRHTKAW